MAMVENSIQTNEEAVMAEFAENLWRNYIKPKYEDASMSNVSFYRAAVVANNGGRILTVQQPYDEPRTVSCTNELSNQEVGSHVAVLKFGNGTAAMNHLAFMALANNGISNVAEVEEEIAELRDDLEAQIDAKIDTWAQEANPANSWTASERPEHDGDLWYYTGTSAITVGGVTIKPTGTYQYDADTNSWVEYSMQTDNLFDFVDHKTTIWYGSPSGTYTGVATGDYLVDDTDGSTYRWDGTQWLRLTDYAAAIAAAVNALQAVLEAQIDAKVETWAQDSNPATNWTTSELREKHNDDLWYYTGLSDLTVGGVTIEPTKTYQYDGTNNTWVVYESPTTSLFDLADGKSTIYYGSPSGTYADVETGDYLVDPNTGNSYQWTGNAWSLVQNLSAFNQNMNAFALSQTGASTATKTATIEPTVTGYSLVTGAQVTVLFTNANTASTPTLSVNGTTSKEIRAFTNAALTSDYYWAAYSAVTFAYNGTYWVMTDPTGVAKAAVAQSTANGAASTASSALSTANSAASTANSALSTATDTSHFFWHDNSTGTHIATVSSSATQSNNLLLNGNGMYVRLGTITLAEYLSTGVNLYEGSSSHKQLASFSTTGLTIYGFLDGRELEIAHMGTNSSGTLSYYTLGSRYDDNDVGDASFAEGYRVRATAAYSHAEGFMNQATAIGAHAEGGHPSGMVGGPYTLASGTASHAEGAGTKASGNYSHAAGYYTTAGSNYQTTIGKYNNNNSSDVFEVGWGEDGARKNLFAVDTSGNIRVKAKVYIGCNDNSAGGTELTGGGISGLTTYGVAYGASATTLGTTAVGSSGYLLKSNAGSSAPSWVNPATLSVNYAASAGTAVQANTANTAGSANTASFADSCTNAVYADKFSNTTAIGSSSQPIYITNKGVPTAVSSVGISYLPTGTTAQTVAIGNHTHGNLKNDGTITTGVSPANGAKIAIFGASDNLLKYSNKTFTNSTTEYLRRDGSWGTPGGSSDARLKDKVSNMDRYEDFFRTLKPVAFKFHKGLYDEDEGKPSTKWGFYAQEVIEAFQDNDLDWEDEALVFIESPENVTENEKQYIDDNKMLRIDYQNMAALNTHMIQKLLDKIDTLEEQVNTLQQQLAQQRGDTHE